MAPVSDGFNQSPFDYGLCMWKWSFSKKVGGVVIYNPETREIVRDGSGNPVTFRPQDVQGIVDEMNSEASLEGNRRRETGV